MTSILYAVFEYQLIWILTVLEWVWYDIDITKVAGAWSCIVDWWDSVKLTSAEDAEDVIAVVLIWDDIIIEWLLNREKMTWY